MMPVPTHLIGCVEPKESTIDETDLVANVVCPCGSNRYVLMFPGQTHNFDGAITPVTAKINGQLFFLIKARCTRCQKEYLLLDYDFHGWNGFVCHDPKQAALPRPALVPWDCLVCGNVEHEAAVRIQTNGKNDFISETGGKFNTDRWPDAFGCFNMSITCTGCKTETPEWVSCETM